jgi:hypothetical protein
MQILIARSIPPCFRTFVMVNMQLYPCYFKIKILMANAIFSFSKLQTPSCAIYEQQAQLAANKT